MFPTYTQHAVAFLSSASLIAASPLTNLDLARRGLLSQRASNPCEPGGNPILYAKQYGPDLCPPAITLSGDGSCPTTWHDCTSYCEIRQNFYYREEVPLDQPYCHGPLTCSISSTKATSYSYTGTIAAPNWLSALGIGITGGYGISTTTTDVRTTSVSLQPGECGYFTFLPIMHDSCGSLSEGTPIDVPRNHCKDVKTTGNVCIEQPFHSADWKFVQGDTIFVRTDCGTRARLPAADQDPAYNHEGVAAPQSVYDIFSTSYDCTLSPECADPVGFGINPACKCTCAGQPANLNDPGCEGFQGSLPHPPGSGPGNGP